MSEFIAAPLVLFIGASLGSFLNVLILRGSWPRGRSKCPQCRQPLRWWELVPVVSFILLQARCARCRTPISFQYPVVEMTMAVSGLVLFIPFPNGFPALALAAAELLIIAVLTMLFIIDLKTMILPDTLIAVLAFLAAVRLIFTPQALPSSPYRGALLGFCLLLFLYLITRGRGIGFGDVKLMLPLGLIFGLGPTLMLLLVSFSAGGALASFLLIAKRANRKTAIPFGPFLTGTAILFILAPSLPQVMLDFIL